MYRCCLEPLPAEGWVNPWPDLAVVAEAVEGDQIWFTSVLPPVNELWSVQGMFSLKSLKLLNSHHRRKCSVRCTGYCLQAFEETSQILSIQLQNGLRLLAPSHKWGLNSKVTQYGSNRIKSQNHGVARVGRDLQRSPRPTLTKTYPSNSCSSHELLSPHRIDGDSTAPVRRISALLVSTAFRPRSDFAGVMSVLWIYLTPVGFSSIFQSGLSRETGWHFSLFWSLLLKKKKYYFFSLCHNPLNNTSEDDREAVFVKCHDHKQSEWLHATFILHQCPLLLLPETTEVHQAKRYLLLQWAVLTTFGSLLF